ncbi:hypothetical protein ZWY2020_054831 [Hordeum vulgare]|nr:hypothetical protein ZWY2020_054831 [Hordeum vulgare]
MGAMLGASNGARDWTTREGGKDVQGGRSACDSPEDEPFMGNLGCGSLEEQIATPGNPFAHLAAYSAGVTMTDVTTTESYGSSAFTRTGLAVLASSAPARLLLHLVVLVSSAASIHAMRGSTPRQRSSCAPGCSYSPRQISASSTSPPPRSGSKEGELPAYLDHGRTAG